MNGGIRREEPKQGIPPLMECPSRSRILGGGQDKANHQTLQRWHRLSKITKNEKGEEMS